MVESTLAVLGRVVGDVWHTFAVNWPYLVLSVIIASALTVYIGADRLQSWLGRRVIFAVIGVVIVAAVTPFCSCGTTAVVLGAMAAHVPWAPVVAFMVSSPLTSPEEYVLASGLFGFSFSTTFFVAAIVIGLAAGAVTHLIERTGWLKDQARMREPVREAALVGTAPATGPGLSLDVIDTSGASSCCGPAEAMVVERTAEPESCCGPPEPQANATPEPPARRMMSLDIIERPVQTDGCCGPAAPLVVEKPAEAESCCEPSEPQVAAMSEAPAGRTLSLEVVEKPTATDGCCGDADEAPQVVAGQTFLGVDRQWLADRKLDQFGTQVWKNGRRLALFFFGFAALGYLLIELIPTSFLTNYLGEDSPFAVVLAALIGIPVYLNTDASLPLVAALMKGGLGSGPALAFLVTGAGTSIGAIGGMLLIARRRVVGLVIGSLMVGGIVLGYLAPIWL